MTDELRLKISLLAMRIGVTLVFLVWTLDKIFNYEHNNIVIGHYYHVELSQPILFFLGCSELAVVFLFFCGLFKTFSYGIILFAHSVTTIVSSWRLFPPYEVHQLLYFGSLPMLGACLGLFLLRNSDSLMTLRITR